MTKPAKRPNSSEQMSKAAVDGFFAIMEKWQVPTDRAGELLDAIALRPDQLTRISYIAVIYKALHVHLPDELADHWVTKPNDNVLFQGQAPIQFMVREGLPGLQQVAAYLQEGGISEIPSEEVARITSKAEAVFGSLDKAVHWLNSPDERFGNRSPVELLATEAGERQVEAMLLQIDHGIYP